MCVLGGGEERETQNRNFWVKSLKINKDRKMPVLVVPMFISEKELKLR